MLVCVQACALCCKLVLVCLQASGATHSATAAVMVLLINLAGLEAAEPLLLVNLKLVETNVSNGGCTQGMAKPEAAEPLPIELLTN